MFNYIEILEEDYKQTRAKEFDLGFCEHELESIQLKITKDCLNKLWNNCGFCLSSES